MATITYKFRDWKYFQTICFEKVDVNVLDFKKGVISQSNDDDTNNDRSFDLIIANQRTGEEYRENNIILPRHTLLVVNRIPATEQRAAKLWEPPSNPTVPPMWESVWVQEEKPSIGLPAGETEKADVVKKPPPVLSMPGPNYICHRCGIPGHWIRNCPTNSNKNFVPVLKKLIEGCGIPAMRSKVPVENPSDNSNRIIVNGKAVSEAELSRTKLEIPATFRCDICWSTLRVATVVPCCKKSFCKECIMQHIWRGGHCPVCYRTVKAEKLQVDQPLQERVNAFSKQLRRYKQKKKIPMDEYVQKKGLLSTPRVRNPKPKLTSFRHNVKPSIIISCLNCNEQGHVFKDCPKLEEKEEPSVVQSSAPLTSPSYIRDDPVIITSPTQFNNSISKESGSEKFLNDTWTKRYLLKLDREYRKSRKKRRRSSSSLSTSSSSSRSRSKRKRRRRRTRCRSRRRRSRKRKSSPSGSSAREDYSSSSHHKQRRDWSGQNQRRIRRYRRDELLSDTGIKEEENRSDQGEWPVIRKPPPPVKPAPNSPLSTYCSSATSLSLSPPPGWRRT